MNELNVALCILACKEEPESTWFNNKFKECEKTKHRCVRYERIEGALKHTELVTAEKIFGELEGVCRCDNCFDKIQDKYLGRNRVEELSYE